MNCWRFWGMILAAIMIVSAANPVAAEPRQKRYRADASQCVMNNDGRKVCHGAVRMALTGHTVTDANGSEVAGASSDATIIGGRPAGCPRQYCGCGLRLYLGLEDKRLNLASNWMRYFPRVAGPAAGVAAVRSGHVMYIEGSAGDGQWMVRDYNSGGGLSRLHVRSVRGYVFVNPHAQMASR